MAEDWERFFTEIHRLACKVREAEAKQAEANKAESQKAKEPTKTGKQ